MTNIWFISDTHLFHENFLTFRDREEKLIRGDKFSSVSEMNSYIRDKWNSVVRPQDKVYHLGDVICGAPDPNEARIFLNSLHGHKRLVLGNHDNCRTPAYSVFEQIMLWTGGKFKEKGFVCSHIPLRKDTIRDGEFNVHGHIHELTINKPVEFGDGPLPVRDPIYINVCVEHWDYTPVHMDQILEIIARNR